jgi:hypothetical protein
MRAGIVVSPVKVELGGRSAAGEGDATGPAQFEDAERFHQLQELVDFAFVPGDLDREAGGLDVDNLRPKDIANLHDFGTGGGGGLHPQQNQFPIDDVPVLEVVDFEDIDQLVELFDDLFQDLIVSDNHKGHAGDFIVLGGADVESIDIKATAAEKTGDSRENAEAVLDYNRDGMSHKKEKVLNNKR